jgi:DNA-binding NarL/FixJ family response regulator
MEPLLRIERPAGVVLIVDDSAYARSRLRKFLLARGYENVGEASDGDEALDWFARHHPTLVLMDQVMRGRAGIETARQMIARDPKVSIVMLTVVTDKAVHEQALSVGVKKVLPKADYEGLAVALAEIERG